MLKTLHIENYALIRESDIQFGPGFVAITGETGAGKSIMLGALGLLLGQRADAAVLADKERKCVVEARFDISGLGLQPLFDEADVDYDDLLILRREILPSAKSRAFANDTPVQLPFLKALAPRIIDIHSQHQTLTLADSQFRLMLLDTLNAKSSTRQPSPPWEDSTRQPSPPREASTRQPSPPREDSTRQPSPPREDFTRQPSPPWEGQGWEKPLDTYRKTYREYISLKRELEELTTTEAQNRRDADYLQFQFSELADAHLVDGEQESLEQESQLLSHAESVREGFAEVAALMDDDEGLAVLPRLRQAKTALSHIADFHPVAKSLLARIDTSFIELDDICNELQHTAEGVTYSPERQQQVDERLAMLYRLEKKHGVDSVAALIALRDELDARLQSIATLDDRIQALMEQVDKAYTVMQSAADTLTASRVKAGKELSKNILPTLHELGMPEARFIVECTPASTYTASGHDSVKFLFNANRGGEVRDIAKVASGGEMSRLMLAIKSMLTSHSLLPTIIFDEIDTGVSGDISVAVGTIMCRMASQMQVIAITHLPQIAAKAGQHLKVYKETDDDHTVSRIRELAPADRINEVAVMLSSEPPTPAALQTAKELMEK